MFPQEFIISFTALMSVGNIKIISSNGKQMPFTDLIIIISMTGELTNHNTFVKFAFIWFVHTLALKSMIFNSEISKLGGCFHHFLSYF